MPGLAFCLDAGPGGWGSAQVKGDPAAMRAAVEKTVALGTAADSAGIDSLWLLEDPDGWDAFAVLGAIARETEHIRLGTGVVNPYYRHPAQIAASVATLDWLSSGRAFLGLGRGQTEWYEHALGMHIGKPTSRLVETISLLRQWWDEPMTATSPEGATELHVTGWERVIRPLQGHVPIYLAAVGPRAMNVAAEHADGVIFNDLSSFGFMREQIQLVKSSAAEVGRDPDAVTFNARCQVTVTDDPEALYERRKSTVAMIHSLPGMERLLQSDRHDIDRIIADVRQAMKVEEVLARGGAFADLRRHGNLQAAKAAIPTELMAELVVAGDIPTVKAKLAELEAIGVTHVFLAAPKEIESLPELVLELRV
jgi:alkanesulfonate monooxygenase SsuD/methylene tetrahydromethanopterin reductase-like flavin-dependent oxidoreductase (luciferase family)